MFNHKELFENASALFTNIFYIKDDRWNSGNYDQTKVLDSAKKTIDSDPTHLTAVSYLEEHALKFFKDVQFNILDILDERESFIFTKNNVAKFIEQLNNQDYIEDKKYFIDIVAMGSKHYGFTDDIEDGEIILARFDSLQSYKNLSINQFLSGGFNEGKPQYIKQIYEWWNINSLLDYATTLPNSISLHLVRHPSLYESYFCFLIKNGANIYILTDHKEHSNPLYSERTRRPDRNFANQISGHSFPYYLLDVVAEDGELYSLESETGTGVVPYQKTTFILSTIDQLHKKNFLWVILMYDLIYQNYFLNEVKLEEMSYTAEMLNKPELLIHKAQSNGLIIQSEPIKFEKISKLSVHTDNIDSKVLGAEAQTSWLEKRYAHLIDDDALALTGLAEETLKYDFKEKSLISSKSSSGLSTDLVTLSKINVSHFSNNESLLADRLYLARNNYVKLLSYHAQIEYDQNKSKFDSWFKKQVDANFDRILDRCKELKANYIYDSKKDELRYIFKKDESDSGIGRSIPRNICTLHLNSESYRIGSAMYSYYKYVNNNFNCFFTGAVAHFVFKIELKTANDLADCFGLSIDQLPDMLKNFNSYGYRSISNSILNRVDPMANINTPFDKNPFSFKLYLSKRAFNKL